MPTTDPQVLLYALLGGILPAIFWLWFWLKEDSRRPEPTGLIMLSFIAGMFAVIIVYPIEKWASFIFEQETVLIVVWSAIEEIVKFGAIALVAFSSKFFDEPVDALVYMITVALGFAALENSLYLISPILDGEIITSILTGNMRYMGATLLHVVSSASIGIAMGLSFYKSTFVKTISIIIGLATAILLHATFNFFIINDKGVDIFTVFLGLWVSVIILIFFFEQVRRIGKRHRAKISSRGL